MAQEVITEAQARKFLPETTKIPPIKLSNPAAEFIDNRIDSEDHPAFSKTSLHPRSTALSDNRLVYRPPNLDALTISNNTDHTACYKELELHQQHFFEALEAFEKTLPEKYRTKFDIRGKHTWEEVIQEAKIAELKYKRKGSDDSPFSKVRGCFRKLQSRVSGFEAWLELIPSSTYSTVVSGGFKIIIRASTRMNEIREFIFTALASIPDEIEKAQLMMEMNRDLKFSPRLHERISELYVSILKVMHHILLWLQKKSAVKQVKSLLQQSEYEKSLESKIDDFKQLVTLVKEEANLCANQRLHVMDMNINAVAHDVDLVLQYAAYNREQQAEVVEGLQALKSLYQLLLSNPQLDPRTGRLRADSYLTAQSSSMTRKAISPKALLEELEHDPSILPNDLRTVLHWGENLSLQEQDRAVHIIQHQKARDWLLAATNGVLLINGNEPELDASVHATSFVLAHLVNSIAATDSMLCMYWFCGQHRNARRDRNATAASIVCSLINQLLEQHKGFDLYFFKRRHLHAVRDRDLETLCNVLDELIAQLPKNTVLFCTLDWLACLEDSKRSSDVYYLVERLYQVASAPHPNGAKFKLLFSHPGGPFRAGRVVSRTDSLVVPESIDGEGMGFSKLRWNSQIGGALREVAKRTREKTKVSSKDEDKD